jgi:long-chain acyl-CoA synthetase
MNAFDFFFETTYSLNKEFVVGKEEISFTDLYIKSHSLSKILRKKLGEEKMVILLSPNNVFFLICYLAILKSGNVCIPLDPMIDKDSLKYIYELTKPSLCCITDQIQKRLEIDHIDFLTPEDIPEINLKQQDISQSDFDSEKCAEIIFTSGSTGSPKGVMLSHKNLISNTESILEYLNLSEKDRMLVVLPFYYCYGLSLLHTHLRVGGSVVFNNSFMFLGAVINDLLQHQCTGFAGVPSHFQILLRKSDSFTTTHFPDLRYVTQAGGKLATVFIDEFINAKPDVRFYVMYGQTEATARLSYLPPDLYNLRRGSIGKGISGVNLRVVNNNDLDVSPGEVGEVVAQGDNVMLGYFKDKQSTKTTIRNGWLYTGDLGTVDSDGFIYLTARKKEIIKVGGKRISPKEIEAIILGIPEVVDCTIVGVEDELQGEALKATVVINADSTSDKIINGEYIKEHCANHLSLYKIPQIIEIKEQLTISATGKKIKKDYNRS